MNKHTYSLHKTVTLLFLGLFSLLSSCNDPAAPTTPKKAAVIFTFDDTNIESWYNNRDLFEQYNIKATFFLSHPEWMSSTMLNQLHELLQAGHEVACHTINHLNALDYLESHTLEEYINTEIIRAKDTMVTLGFAPKTFAMPYGLSNNTIDQEILKHFSRIRSATQNYNNTTLDQIDEIFYKWDGNLVPNAMGIDVFYNISIANLTNGLERAKNNQEVIIFYAHKIDDSGNNFTTSRAYLEAAFQAANQLKLESIRFGDLN